MDKKALVVGNWKMELSHKASVEVAKSLFGLIKERPMRTEVVMCPSYPSLPAISEMSEKEGGRIGVGAQNIHYEERGAWTGLVSVQQVRTFAKWCIAGHSEQRAFSGESQEDVARKAGLLLRHGLVPIICVGETEEERHNDETVAKISEQVGVLLRELDRVSFTKIIIAYEPIWAIGTGVVPAPDDTAEILLLIRKLVANRFDQSIAGRLRILYGGSVKPDNVSGYIEGPGADGVLVGGASTHPRQFADIVNRVEEVWEGRMS